MKREGDKKNKDLKWSHLVFYKKYIVSIINHCNNITTVSMRKNTKRDLGWVQHFFVSKRVCSHHTSSTYARFNFLNMSMICLPYNIVEL